MYGFPVPGERRDGRVIVPWLRVPLSDTTLTELGEVPGQCFGAYSQQWLHTPDATFVTFDVEPFTPYPREVIVVYESPDDLAGRIRRTCWQGASLLVDIGRSGSQPRGTDVALEDGGLIACASRLDDAGVPIELQLLRADGGYIAGVASSERSCSDLRGRLAIARTFAGDGGLNSELINFATGTSARLPANAQCQLTTDEAVLCGRTSSVTLHGPGGERALLQESGVGFRVWKPTVRGRQYVQSLRPDGGSDFYLFRDQQLEPLVDGLPRYTAIGDWDDGNAMTVSITRFKEDGGTWDFERICLP